jgi:S1-C subfamily serine protease
MVPAAPPTSQPRIPPAWQDRWRRLRTGVRRALPFAGGVLAALAAILLYTVLFPGPAPLTTRDVNDTVASALASVTPAPARSAQVYALVQPSLVLIQTTFPPVEGATEPTEGLGTGVIVSANGDILTSLHVVSGATSLVLYFMDGTRSPGALVNAVPEKDIAVLAAGRLPELFTPAILGSPGALRVGDEAYAVGHPLGLVASISAGVVSGLDRTYHLPETDQTIEGLIQIDAAVNPGNSGGPLLNRAGEVVGIVTALANPTDQDVFIGIGFAVPIDQAGGAAGLPNY